jgi:hypothetical protein
LAGLLSAGLKDGMGGGRASRGVGVFCALRAWSALRRYSDFGATECEGVRVTVGLVCSGVVGRWVAHREEPRDDVGVDMFLKNVQKEEVGKEKSQVELNVKPLVTQHK